MNFEQDLNLDLELKTRNGSSVNPSHGSHTSKSRSIGSAASDSRSAAIEYETQTIISPKTHTTYILRKKSKPNSNSNSNSNVDLNPKTSNSTTMIMTKTQQQNIYKSKSIDSNSPGTHRLNPMSSLSDAETKSEATSSQYESGQTAIAIETTHERVQSASLQVQSSQSAGEKDEGRMGVDDNEKEQTEQTEQNEENRTSNLGIKSSNAVDAIKQYQRKKISGLNPSNKDDVLTFHNITQYENSLLFLSCKLILLILVCAFSSLIVFLLWEFVTGSAYMIDSMINIYCIWLTFEFSSKQFWKCFGGKYCIKCAFPYIKTFALTCCNQCYKHATYILDKKEIDSKQDSSMKIRKRVWLLSKYEYDYIVKHEGEHVISGLEPKMKVRNPSTSNSNLEKK